MMQMDKISDAIHVFIEKDENRILTKRVHSLSLSLSVIATIITISNIFMRIVIDAVGAAVVAPSHDAAKHIRFSVFLL